MCQTQTVHQQDQWKGISRFRNAQCDEIEHSLCDEDIWNWSFAANADMIFLANRNFKVEPSISFAIIECIAAASLCHVTSLRKSLHSFANQLWMKHCKILKSSWKEI